VGADCAIRSRGWWKGSGATSLKPRERAAVSAAGVEWGDHCFVAEGTGLETDGVPAVGGASSDWPTRKYRPKAPSS